MNQPNVRSTTSKRKVPVLRWAATQEAKGAPL